MPRARRRLTAAIAVPVAVAALGAAGAAHAGITLPAETWISGVGDDANTCQRYDPCKTIQGALPRTADGGIINALNPGGFGAATINKPITIDLSSTWGSVLAAGTNGLIIDTAGDVVLRGINIFGPGCTSPMLSGVRIVRAHHVTIENSQIGNASVAAISVVNGADSTPIVTTTGLRIRNACPVGPSGTAVGVLASPTGGGTARVLVDHSIISGMPTGVRATDNGAVTLLASLVTANTLGLDPQGTGGIALDSASRVVGNATDGAPTSVIPDPSAPQDATSATAAGASPIGPRLPARAQGSVMLRATLVRTQRARGVRLAYLSTATGPATMVVSRRGHVAAQTRVRIHSGAHGLRWNGRLRDGRIAPAGRYEVTVTLRGRGRPSSTRTHVLVTR